MFKKFLIFGFVINMFFNFQLKADEGMWLLSMINKNYADMKAKGLTLSAKDIYDINNACLKDAIIKFGNGCTGEVVSSEGLVLTNHHCGFSSIQYHSTVENDYLVDGFWAMKKSEELYNEDLTVTFLIKLEDVSAKINVELTPAMTESERQKKAYELGQEIAKKASKGTKYTTRVRSLFNSNSFYLFTYMIYKDVRLVGAPPSAIGKFGGDTDNWMWPRHTGDFSMFRIYTAPDGSPAEYSLNNVPLKPKYHLPVSLNGVKENDFAMILGYPGGTDRYLTSYGVKQAIDVKNPTIVKIRDKKLSILRNDMGKSQITRIQYASKYARTSNYWKYFIGQTKGLKRLKIYEKKKELENKFQTWAVSTPQNKSEYANVLSDLESTYKNLDKYTLLRIYYSEAAMRGPDILGYAKTYMKFQNLLVKEKDNKEKDNTLLAAKMETITALKDKIGNFYKDFNLDTEKKLFSSLLEMYYNDVDKEFHPSIFATIESKYKGNFDKFTNAMFAKSVFSTKEKMFNYFNKPSYKTLEKDLVYKTMLSIYDNEQKINKQFQKNYETLAQGRRLFLKGLLEMQPNKNFYPDANMTMRLSYGQVLSYDPRDAVEFNYYTTLKGVIDKEDDDNDDFTVPQKLKDLYESKNFGNYDTDGDVRVCFTTNNDITGGNSGSPVINGNGELIGLAFDGNWEAMSGDIAFEPELQRTIVADIRYVLFIIDKYAGAKNLINEMTLVKASNNIVLSENQEMTEFANLVEEFSKLNNSNDKDLLKNIRVLIRNTNKYTKLTEAQKKEKFNKIISVSNDFRNPMKIKMQTLFSMEYKNYSN